MTGIEILMATSALLAVPAIASRWKIKPHPVALASVWSVGLAALIVMTTLTICAVALIGWFASGAESMAFSPRHLIPSVPFTGWISLLIITLAFIGGARAFFSALWRRHLLYEQLRFADVTKIDDVAVVTLPTQEFVALAVPGPKGCVLMSQGAIQRLTGPELLAVVHHEEAHRRRGHHRHLLLARAAERALWFVPGMRHATRALRNSLEIVADSDACQAVEASTLRAALVDNASSNDPVAAKRMSLLDQDPSTRSALAALSVGLGLVSVLAVALELSWLGIGI